MSYLIFFCILFVGLHDHRLRLLPTVHYFFSIISKIYLQPKHNAVNPLAALSLLRPRLILPFLLLSPIAGIRGAAAGISPPRRNPPCIYIRISIPCVALREVYPGMTAHPPTILSNTSTATRTQYAETEENNTEQHDVRRRV